jgi:hypothetical protein
LYTGHNIPSSTEKKPFFEVWGPPNHLRSAWQPIVEPNSRHEIVEAKAAKVQAYCEIAVELLEHVSDIVNK